ncbi:helix-turn-helix transcriptional regulator [Kitasatospora sp. GP30]|uniref:helix-turn-helix domain-containing protein n=1 Tax=Kitasatospora sp. GP30 TaxID=3035084 RepID=UPI002473B10F|nr:helix-turn-helix transcriptional regulator [Kitasatospora sp. GP30]
MEQRPTVRRRVLGTNLRRLREDLGLLLEDAAAQLSCHPAKISRIESGRSGIRPLDLKALLDLYSVVNPQERDGWLALAREGRHQRWWRMLEDQLPQDFLDLIGLEEDVSECRGFQPSVIPGLFQTEAYATAIIQGGSAGPLTDSQRIKVQVRMERQKALTRAQPAPLTTWLILGEAALRQQVGGPAVLHNQLLHLAEVALLPNVTVQVLPFTAGAVMGGPFPFMAYRFPPPSSLEVVVLENATSHAYLEDPRETAPYDHAFNHLRAAALSVLESEAFITRLASELP